MVYLLLAIEAICSPHPQSIIASRALYSSSSYFPLAINASLTAAFISALSSGVALITFY